jgi:hypothetical protein
MSASGLVGSAREVSVRGAKRVKWVVPSDPGQRYVRIWWPIFLVTQIAAWFVISRMEPDGFDRCTAAPSPAEMQLQVNTAISAGVILLAAVALLRGGRLVVAVIWIGLLSFPFWVLLRDAGTC